ncbi:TetR family transcriptional regulator [Spirillospora sp. CA-255316]
MDAGAEIIHGLPIWNWHALTVRAVAERAGVNVRTVYRHFATERDLRAAVLHRLRKEAGIDLADMRLEDVAGITARLLRYVSTFPIEPRTPRDPSVAAANRAQREALRGAVAGPAESWPAADRVIAASVLDVLWSVVSYERLVTDWELDPKEAITAITWVIGLVEDAVREGRRPSS